MATLRFKLLASLVSRGHYPRSITTWHLGIDPHFSYAWGAVLIPIQHENMSARRWPVITLALILVNLRHLCRYSSHRGPARFTALEGRRAHSHPCRHAPESGPSSRGQRSLRRVFGASFRTIGPRCKTLNSDAVDEWDARTRLIEDPAELQEEMDSLGDQYSQLTASSITERYAFIPAHPRPITYITSTFLHVDWWHVIGNMWFLWLAGFVLEDAWGRPLYLLVYLAAGAFACQFDAWVNPVSIVHSVGASGAVAGLMGAFLVRFPKMKIRMMWFFDLGLFPFCRFWMRAYWLLPIWVLMEINYGTGPRDGIGHWAHVGGFLFGGIAGCGVALLRLRTQSE